MREPKQNSKLSQVFLHTSWPCDTLADVLVENSVGAVIEIGPGKGILTESLLKRDLHVTCVERDARFVTYLQKRFETEISEGKLLIIHQDALHFDWAHWRELNRQRGRLGICGNIPYHISSPLLEQILPQLGEIQVAVLLVQLEFAERLASAPGVKSYGSLSVFAQLRATMTLVSKVDRSCFTPVPKVDSAIIAMSPRAQKENAELLKKVEKLTKRAFSQRRKKLSNALSAFLETVDTEKVRIDLNRRPDTLKPEEYLELAQDFPDNPFFQ